MSVFGVNIWSFEKELYSGKAKSLEARAIDGQVGILPGHISYINELAKGKIKFTDEDDRVMYFETAGGFIKVNKDQAYLFVRNAKKLN